ncbi:MAG: Asp-tRNA(Asn)/Glu-tRNA(Gln) amidotransferase subunit GatB [Chloroflexota bacterium]|nr:Asp-tRNA(Asn)/Glu-tRNA(Gln) amidotransferase subunit GatB [Chloroflexota bacterium]
MEYETIIGLEVHSQLLTASKMFCNCDADYSNTTPNTHVCPVCLGMPGVMPVINKKALEYTAMTALALNCDIPEYSKFDRKNYPYPDLMKGYQISQYDAPIGLGGWLDVTVDGETRRIGITRVHLEEDTARLTHRTGSKGESYSLVDVNRAGTPLMEIVGEPDIRSPEEARQYLVSLRAILQFLGVSNGNMEEGSFRCDANISIRKPGEPLSIKVEIKNMNSFRAVYRALDFEVKRQCKAVESGERIIQETRGWMEDDGVTVSQRSKEHAHDYRYFPEPDLPPMVFSRDWINELMARLPELPVARRNRFVSEHGLSEYDAGLLTTSKSMSDFFERCVELRSGGGDKKQAKVVSNWITGELFRLLNANDIDVENSKITPEQLSEMLELVDNGALSVSAAKAVFEEMFNSGKRADEVVAERGLSQISDTNELEDIVDRVIADNPQPVADFRQGKEKAQGFLVGQIMRATKGRANPALVNKLLRERLES